MDSFVYRIAITTWDRQTTAIVPGELDVDIDVDGDGDPDFDVFSAPASITAANQLGDGRALTFVYDYAADASTPGSTRTAGRTTRTRSSRSAATRSA